MTYFKITTSHLKNILMFKQNDMHGGSFNTMIVQMMRKLIN